MYAALARSVAGMERDEQNGMSADVLGRRIVAIAQKRHPKALYSCGLQYQFFLLLARLLPVRTLNWLVGLLYARRNARSRNANADEAPPPRSLVCVCRAARFRPTDVTR